MANLEGFNANEVEPNEGFSPVPAGDYDVIITSSEMKPTKSGTGQYLELKLQILKGPNQNRVLFDRLNLVNSNAQAVQIAKGTLSAICRAVGVMTPKDSSELHNKPMTATVKVKNDNNGNPQNEVKGYKPRHAGPAAQQQPAAPNMIEQAFEPAGATQPQSPF